METKDVPEGQQSLSSEVDSASIGTCSFSSIGNNHTESLIEKKDGIENGVGADEKSQDHDANIDIDIDELITCVPQPHQTGNTLCSNNGEPFEKNADSVAGAGNVGNGKHKAQPSSTKNRANITEDSALDISDYFVDISGEHQNHPDNLRDTGELRFPEAVSRLQSMSGLDSATIDKTQKQVFNANAKHGDLSPADATLNEAHCTTLIKAPEQLPQSYDENCNSKEATNNPSNKCKIASASDPFAHVEAEGDVESTMRGILVGVQEPTAKEKKERVEEKKTMTENAEIGPLQKRQTKADMNAKHNKTTGHNAISFGSKDEDRSPLDAEVADAHSFFFAGSLEKASNQEGKNVSGATSDASKRDHSKPHKNLESKKGCGHSAVALVSGGNKFLNGCGMKQHSGEAPGSEVLMKNDEVVTNVQSLAVSANHDGTILHKSGNDTLTPVDAHTIVVNDTINKGIDDKNHSFTKSRAAVGIKCNDFKISTEDGAMLPFTEFASMSSIGLGSGNSFPPNSFDTGSSTPECRNLHTSSPLTSEKANPYSKQDDYNSSQKRTKIRSKGSIPTASNITTAQNSPSLVRKTMAGVTHSGIAQNTTANSKVCGEGVDVGEEAFELLCRKTNTKKKKKRKTSKRVTVKISMLSYKNTQLATKLSRENTATDDTSIGDIVRDKEPMVLQRSFSFGALSIDSNNENDPLAFFSETHEEQDPAFIEFYASKMKKRLDTELAKLAVEAKEDIAKINKFLSTKWEERNEALQSRIKKAKGDMVTKQNLQRTQLAERHKKLLESDEKKIKEGMKWLTQRQRQELERKMQQYQHETQLKGLSQEQNIVEWNKVSIQLQNRHTQQLKRFEVRKIEMKKKSEHDLKTQTATLEAHHKKRQAEMDDFVRELESNYLKQQEKQKIRLFRLHNERFQKRRDVIKKECATSFVSNSALETGADKFSGVDSGIYAFNEIDRFSQKEYKQQSLPAIEDDSYVFHLNRNTKLIESTVSHNAIQRHKRRKCVMNNASVQLAVEIHNEGIIVMTRSGQHEGEKPMVENDESFSIAAGATNVDKSSYGRTTNFVPWGPKARRLICTIMYGEIPSGYGCDEINCSGQGILEGGMVKCIVTDMRTSEQNAIRERAEALIDLEERSSKAGIEELEIQYSNASVLVSNLETECEMAMSKEDKAAKSHKEAAQQHDKAKATFDKFKIEAQRYFNEDGTPSPHINPGNQHKLLTAMCKFKGAYETAKVEEMTLRKALEAARSAANMKKIELQKAQQVSHTTGEVLKEARRNLTIGKDKIKLNKSQMLNCFNEAVLSERRIESIAAALRLTAERRRSQMNRKKHNLSTNTSSDKPVTNMREGINKNLWQKFQRRRVTILLRPSRARILREVKEIVDRSNKSSKEKKHHFDLEESKIIDSSLRAEQLLLLALHPEAPSSPPIPISPSSSSNFHWAEPGWQLVLDVPSIRQTSPFSLLPTDNEGHLLRTLLSDCSSSPGRQAASFIKSRHLRILTAPLSSISQASAPSETSPPFQQVTEELMEIDPICNSEEKILLGYSFALTGPSNDEKKNYKRDADCDGKEIALPTKRRRSSRSDKLDLEVSNSALNDPLPDKNARKTQPSRRRKSQTSKKRSGSPCLALPSKSEKLTDGGNNVQASANATSRSKLITVQQSINSESISPTSTNNVLSHQPTTFDRHQTNQYRLFLMQQQQQQQQQQNQTLQSPTNQQNFSSSRLQQQQQFQHFMQMRMLAQTRKRQQHASQVSVYPLNQPQQYQQSQQAQQMQQQQQMQQLQQQKQLQHQQLQQQLRNQPSQMQHVQLMTSQQPQQTQISSPQQFSQQQMNVSSGTTQSQPTQQNVLGNNTNQNYLPSGPAPANQQNSQLNGFSDSLFGLFSGDNPFV